MNDEKATAKFYSKVHMVDSDAVTLASALSTLIQALETCPRGVPLKMTAGRINDPIAGDLLQIEIWSPA